MRVTSQKDLQRQVFFCAWYNKPKGGGGNMIWNRYIPAPVPGARNIKRRAK